MTSALDTSANPKAAHPVVSATQVDEAADRLKGVARPTPISPIERLSEALDVPVVVKREDLQPCRSFKLRGAYNRISRLSDDERQTGIVCASAGNHAQGVALACAELGTHGTIFLPSSTPRQKRERIQHLGGDSVDMVFVDGSFDHTQDEAQAYAQETGRVYVHPYDDPDVIAGQGTVAKEIAEELGDELGTVVIPIGGGGLVSGVAVWLKENRPDVQIIGVDPAGAASASAALDKGEPVDLGKVDAFVDGTAVSKIGDHTFEIIRDLVDQVVVVPEGAVSREMLDLYHVDGIIAEPAGALSSAAVAMVARGELPEVELRGTTAAVISGGNNDLSRHAEVLERSLVYQGLRHYFLVSVPQRPGALRSFLDEVLGPDDDILYFEYTKKNSRETGPALVGIDLQRPEDIVALRKRIQESDLHIEEIDVNSELMRFLL